MPTPTPAIRISCPVCKVRLPADSTTCPDCGQDLAVLVREARRVDILYNEGLAAAKAGDDAAAVRRLEDALTLAPQRTDVLDLLARLYLRRGLHSDALAAWKRIVELTPDHTAAKDAVRDLQAALDRERRDALARAQQNNRRRRITMLSIAAGAGVLASALVAGGFFLLSPTTPAAPPSPAASLTPPPSATPASSATPAPTPTPAPTAAPPTPTVVPPTPTALPTATSAPNYAADVGAALRADPQLANMGITVEQQGNSIFLIGQVAELKIKVRVEEAARSALPAGVAVDVGRIEIKPDYEVQPGDTLQKIARRVFEDARRWKDIAALNGIADPARLQPGQTLKLPPK